MVQYPIWFILVHFILSVACLLWWYCVYKKSCTRVLWHILQNGGHGLNLECPFSQKSSGRDTLFLWPISWLYHQCTFIFISGHICCITNVTEILEMWLSYQQLEVPNPNLGETIAMWKASSSVLLKHENVYLSNSITGGVHNKLACHGTIKQIIKQTKYSSYLTGCTFMYFNVTQYYTTWY